MRGEMRSTGTAAGRRSFPLCFWERGREGEREEGRISLSGNMHNHSHLLPSFPPSLPPRLPKNRQLHRIKHRPDPLPLLQQCSGLSNHSSAHTPVAPVPPSLPPSLPTYRKSTSWTGSKTALTLSLSSSSGLSNPSSAHTPVAPVPPFASLAAISYNWST